MSRSIGQVTIRSDGLVVNATPINEYPQKLPDLKADVKSWKGDLDKWYENLMLALLRNYGKDGRSIEVFEQTDEPLSAKEGDIWIEP